MPIQLDRSVGRLHAECHERSLGPMARVSHPEHPYGIFHEFLEPSRCRMFLLAVLVVGSKQGEDVASDAPISRLNTCHCVRPDTRRDRDRARRNMNLLRMALPISMGSCDVEQLF